jgi:hypothetical protein
LHVPARRGDGLVIRDPAADLPAAVTNDPFLSLTVIAPGQA